MVNSNDATPTKEQRETKEEELPAADDRRALLKKLGRFGAYTAPAMVAILTPAPQAVAPSHQTF